MIPMFSPHLIAHFSQSIKCRGTRSSLLPSYGMIVALVSIHPNCKTIEKVYIAHPKAIDFFCDYFMKLRQQEKDKNTILWPSSPRRSIIKVLRAFIRKRRSERIKLVMPSFVEKWIISFTESCSTPPDEWTKILCFGLYSSGQF